jgi:hypothetical protein
MNTHGSETATSAAPPTRKHPVQRFMDNPWLLLALGVIIPLLSYTVWGWVELLLVKQAPLP